MQVLFFSRHVCHHAGPPLLSALLFHCPSPCGLWSSHFSFFLQAATPSPPCSHCSSPFWAHVQSSSIFSFRSHHWSYSRLLFQILPRFGRVVVTIFLGSFSRTSIWNYPASALLLLLISRLRFLTVVQAAPASLAVWCSCSDQYSVFFRSSAGWKSFLYLVLTFLDFFSTSIVLCHGHAYIDRQTLPRLPLLFQSSLCLVSVHSFSSLCIFLHSASVPLLLHCLPVGRSCSVYADTLMKQGLYRLQNQDVRK